MLSTRGKYFLGSPTIDSSKHSSYVELVHPKITPAAADTAADGAGTAGGRREAAGSAGRWRIGAIPAGPIASAASSSCPSRCCAKPPSARRLSSPPSPGKRRRGAGSWEGRGAREEGAAPCAGRRGAAGRACSGACHGGESSGSREAEASRGGEAVEEGPDGGWERRCISSLRMRYVRCCCECICCWYIMCCCMCSCWLEIG
mmetsp:Transcript_14351/g.35846  ORF Transcript_14351/g.35846 Transcript_14351/m.35846 type:complete len:202 (-) Transcript_14351:125-730(-)